MSTFPPPFTSNRPANTRAVFQVGELVSTLKHGLEMNFPAMWVEGEISNFIAARSGHWYFTLKDQQAQIRCAFFRNQNLRKTAPSNGQRCLLHARPTIFTARGELQLLVDDLEDAGDGALHLAFERLKRKLSDEGLFATETKRAIPTSPRRIGILTSPAGAAIHDVLTTLRRRDPLIEVILYPVTVQGDAAAAQINTMLLKALLRKECDVLLLTRGGGSLEDLQAFNDERLARTIANAEIPIVSAIGHEVDFSICDFVADARAATPTAAAELLSPDRVQQARHIRDLRTRLVQKLTQYHSRQQQQLSNLQMRLHNVSPQRRLLDRAQQLDDLQRRLILAIQQRLKRGRQQLNHLTLEGRSAPLASRIREAQRRHDALRKRLLQLEQQTLQEKATRLAHLTERLQDLAPDRILARGYAIPWQDDTVVRNPTAVLAGSKLRVQLATGNIWATVGEKA